jgi:poly(3-hydroxybutyrate) depolymerase
MRARTTWVALTSVVGFSLACSMDLPEDLKGASAIPSSVAKESPEGDPCSTWNEEGQRKIEIAVDGKTYEVPIRVPRNRTSDTLIVLLHGGNGDAQKVLKQTDFGPFADEFGIALAIPEADVQPDRDNKRKWNSGKAPFPNGRNDTKFLDAIAAEARKDGCLSKVAGIGFSNGAQMVNRWACEGSEVDAVVAVAGGLLVPPSTCTDRSIPVLLYVGANDEAFQGSPSKHAKLPSIVDSVAAWRKKNSCTEEVAASLDVNATTCRTWNGDAPVRFCVTKGMGHAYPTNKNGRTIHATRDAWTWLEAN